MPNLRFFHLFFSILHRFHSPIRRATLQLRTWCSLLWRSLVSYATRRYRQSQIRLYASAPAVVDNHTTARQPQTVTQCDEVEEEHRENPPGESRWKTKLPTYQVSSKYFERTPATPERASQRYQQRRISRKPNSLTLEPGQMEFLGLLPLEGGWGQNIHPEGNVLFYHKEMRLATESDIRDTTTRERVLFVATTLIQLAIEKQNCVSLDEFTELILNVHNGVWYYYFVDHSHRLLFWVDQIDMHQLGNRLQGVTQHSHIKYLVESLYWYVFLRASWYGLCDLVTRMHCEYYPYTHGHTLPEGIMKDLRGMLNHAKTDMMTGRSPSSPFGKDELVSISDLVNSLKEDEMNNNSYSVWVIARLMSYFTDNRFVNFCGQPTVRLNADKPLFESPAWDRHPLFKIIDVFLLRSPNEHAHRLHLVWVDNMIIQPRWKEFVDRLTTEWSRYTIFSTVMLAVDVSFLAVPGVIDPAHGANTIEIIIYCSIVATIASIVFSFTLLNAYTNPGLTRAVPAGEAMHVLSRIRAGMACLAITHSLPMASLIWSITLFSTALAIQLFSPKQRATVVTLGVECFIIVFFVMMCFSVTGMLCRFGDSEGDDGDPLSEKTTTPGDPQSNA